MSTFLSPLRLAFRGWYFLLTLGVAFLYILLPALIINQVIIFVVLTSSDPVMFKLSFLITLFLGTVTILPPIEIFFTLLTALLLGINITLLTKTVRLLATEKKVSVTVGGVSLLAIAGAGCASCGISLLSILGISTALLPIHGSAFLIVSSGLLVLSLFIILKNKQIVCRLH